MLATASLQGSKSHYYRPLTSSPHRHSSRSLLYIGHSLGVSECLGFAPSSSASRLNVAGREGLRSIFLSIQMKPRVYGHRDLLDAFRRGASRCFLQKLNIKKMSTRCAVAKVTGVGYPVLSCLSIHVFPSLMIQKR